MTESRTDEATDTDERLRKLEEEYLARQTALTEVLKVVGGPAFDLDDCAAGDPRERRPALCHADFGTIYLPDGDVYRVVAGVGPGGSRSRSPTSAIIPTVRVATA